MKRYAQQIKVAGIGSEGQDRIRNAKVLVVGAGGLGTPCAAYLAASGVGTLGIADGDMIQLSNLNRQFLFLPEETGLNKSVVLSEKLKRQNPDVCVEPFAFFVNETNVDSLLKTYNIICDCTDNVETRLLLDEVCASYAKPLIYAAVREWEGYLTVLHYKRKITLTDIFDAEVLRENSGDNCNVSGIVGTVCGTLGSLQAGEALKMILGSGEILDGEILCLSTLAGGFRKFKISRRNSR